jgi:hypothetical protein
MNGKTAFSFFSSIKADHASPNFAEQNDPLLSIVALLIQRMIVKTRTLQSLHPSVDSKSGYRSR